MASSTINYSQIKRVYACLRSAGEDNDFLHDMLPEWTGKTSIKALTPKEADTVCDNLLKKANEAPKGISYRTNKQFGKIMRLSERLQHTPEHLKNFILHTTKTKSDVNALTVTEAGAVITGLSKQLIQKAAKRIESKELM